MGHRVSDTAAGFFAGAFLMAIACLLCINFISLPMKEQAMYPLAGTVLETDSLFDLVTFRDHAGHLWQFEGVDDWQPGDDLIAVMDSRNTDDPTDDIIVSLRYVNALAN